MVARIHPIRIHGTQILDLQLNQRTRQLRLISQVQCELIGLEFVATAENIHEELDDGVHWGQSVGEEDETDYDGEFFVETEGLVEGFIVDEDGEEGEDVEEMGL